MPFQPSDIDKFVWLAREDVPNSPLPILRRITQRVLRDFTGDTYCLNRLVTETFAYSPDLNVTPIPDERISVETTPGGKETLVEDSPPGGVVTDGRHADVGRSIWFVDDFDGLVGLPIWGTWASLEATGKPVGLAGDYELYMKIGGGMNIADPHVQVQYEIGSGLLVRMYVNDSVTYDYTDPSFTLGLDESIQVNIDKGETETSISINAASVLTFPNNDLYPYPGLSFFESWGRHDPLMSPPVLYVFAITAEEIAQTIVTVNPDVEEPVTVKFETDFYAQTVPAELLEHAAIIKHGILARLLAQENKTWSNPTLAELNRLEYEKGKGDVKAAFFRSNGAEV